MVCDFSEYTRKDLAASVLTSWIPHSGQKKQLPCKGHVSMAVEKPTREKLRPPSQQTAPTCQLCE